MEYKKYNQVPFGIDIVDILEEYVQKLRKNIGIQMIVRLSFGFLLIMKV